MKKGEPEGDARCVLSEDSSFLLPKHLQGAEGDT